jgi:uncharacterized protein
MRALTKLAATALRWRCFFGRLSGGDWIGLEDEPVSDLDTKRERLAEYIGQFKSCAVAFSAGVDSTVVARAARDVLGDRAVAVTAQSASLAQGELELARQLAAEMGIRHEVIQTEEFSQQDYTRNAPDRCYHCKTELYSQLEKLAPRLGVEVLFNGANLDDLGDYRPGMTAASEHDVKSPLVECGFHKQDVRDLAAYWELPVWDKPASPCLSSRVAYGLEVTPERLARIDAAEQFLRGHGFSPLRVREHPGDVARIEVPLEQVEQLCHPPLLCQVNEYLGQLGYQDVSVDLAGFRSGSLNQLVTLDAGPAEKES